MTDVAGEPGAGPGGDDALAARAADLATEVTEERQPHQRRRLIEACMAGARSGARATGRGVRATGRGVRAARHGAHTGTSWLADQVVAMAPRLRVRNQAALRAQFPGLSAEDIADALITGAARASAAVGGAVGAWAALPVLPAFPVEVVTETLALVGIEIKLIAELHELYGMPAPGSAADRATAYIGAWAHRRGVLAVAPGGLILAAGSPLARLLRRRLAGRVGRSVFSLGPLFTGAMAGAMLNSRETRRLGQEVRADLRRRAPLPPPPGWEPVPRPDPPHWQPPTLPDPAKSAPQARAARRTPRLRRHPRTPALPPAPDSPPDPPAPNP
jgi:hypothetical protein